MTLFVLEGVSASGKSTVRDELIEMKPEWVMWKGENLMRKGVGDDWVDYRQRYHEALHRLYELNPENVILADRGFTDTVYNSDEKMREEFKRLAACYGDVYILYFYPGELETEEVVRASAVSNRIAPTVSDGLVHDDSGEEILRARGSRDGLRMRELLSRYTELLEMFPYHHVNTDANTETESAIEARRYIESIHEENVHNPDV